MTPDKVDIEGIRKCHRKYDYENRCDCCSSFIPSGVNKDGLLHSGYCKTFSFIDGKWVGTIMHSRVQGRCPYSKVIGEKVWKKE